jgi:polyisoprenoid-binding protein YceI
MIKSLFLASTLLCVSLSAIAAPRGLLVAESKIEFTVTQMGVPVVGRFKKFDASIDLNNEHIEQSSAHFRIDIASLDTGNDEANAIATNADWLNQPQAPFATFKSSQISALGQGRFEAKGMLTIRNKPRDLRLSFERVDQPNGNTMIKSRFIIKRSEFGIGGGMWNEGGVVSEDIPVNIQLLLAPAGKLKK